MGRCKLDCPDGFQYISCYSLSDGFLRGMPKELLFQYISCYSLSAGLTVIERRAAWFQYISCYSLSEHNSQDPQWRQVFQYISCYSLSPVRLQEGERRNSFNTSHVTLYHRQRWRLYSNQCVSIHLMLLFIWLYLIRNEINFVVSIHLMLLFISVRSLTPVSTWRFNTSHVTLYPSFYRLFFF